MNKTALITGITGQDGSYLTELLLSKDYTVYGLIRKSSVGSNLKNLGPANAFAKGRLHYIHGDMIDSDSIYNAVAQSTPHEIYNLAAQSFVADSWMTPGYTMRVNGMGFVHLLEAARAVVPNARIYQASTSEMYGNVATADGSLSEVNRMKPRSPYGVAKLAAHSMAAVYRESYDSFVACGICFNHESPRRGPMFVTRKIAKAVAEIHFGLRDHITLGNLEPRRDWGYAVDYVKAMHMMLQADEPKDYVIATGEAHSVAEFLNAAFACVGIDDWSDYIRQDERFMRPAEIYHLQGDSTLIQEELGWQPRVKFRTLAELMVGAEVARLTGKKFEGRQDIDED